MSREVVIKCKTCGNTLGEFEFVDMLKFKFKCKKCKAKNIGVLREKHKNESTK